MSTEIMQAVVLACDGCEERIGEDGSLRTTVEARAYAYSQGWRFVPRIKKDGTPSRGVTSQLVSDVCPNCLPTWQPQRYRPTGAGQ